MTQKLNLPPRCIELEEEDEEDQDGDNSSDSSEASSSDGAPFSPASSAGPRNSTAIFEPGHPSAFTSYVRKRGEPDGRQAHDSPPLSGSSGSGGASSSFPQIPPPPQMMMMTPMSIAQAQTQAQQQPIYQNQSGRKGGHESDCNFTPSPVCGNLLGQSLAKRPFRSCVIHVRGKFTQPSKSLFAGSVHN